MKKLFFLLAILFVVQFSYAQDGSFSSVSIGYNTANGSGLTISNANNSAYSTLQVNGSTGYSVPSWANSTVFESVPVSTGGLVLSSYTGDINFQTSNRSNRMTVAANGYVGIGIDAPNYKLDINKTGAGSAINITGQAIGTRNDTGIDFSATNGTTVNYAKVGLQISTDTLSHETGGLTFSTIYDGSLSEKMFIGGDGNVAIGTTDAQGYKLAVNGSMIATSVVVKPHGSWPDYVFKPQYKLPSLSEIKTYIDQNQHLPEMPSENEVAKHGVDLGDIVKIQTKKIEELTLYLIEQKKEMKDQKEEQQKEIDNLKAQVSQLLKH